MYIGIPVFCFNGWPFVNIGKVMSMARPRSQRERTPFGQRMHAARAHAQLTQMEVHAAIGIGQSTLTDLESTASSSGWTPQLAGLYEVDALWLATGAGRAPSWWDSQHLVAGEERTPYVVAQSMSHLQLDHAPQINWESILTSGSLPKYFWTRLADDAMAPRAGRGKLICFDSTASPRPGDGVLIVDGAGDLYFRLYRSGPAGRWVAHALNPIFHDMDSERDQLRVLAVLHAEEGRWT